MLLKWFIFYTNPKAEKCLQLELERQNYEVFLPLHKVQRQWKDRRKTLELPLFPNYIFVRTVKENLYNILTIPKIVSFIAFEKKAATLKDEEINFIREVCSSGNNIFISNLKRGDKIRIKEGPLMGYIGVLTECAGKKRFGLELAELGNTIYVDLERTKFERVNPFNTRNLINA